MQVLIVQNQTDLAKLWGRYLERRGATVHLVEDQERAVAVLNTSDVRVIILTLALDKGSALAVADYASYRRPEARIIFVSNSSFFSDGSIFAHFANARVMMPEDTAPEDLIAVVEHYAAN